MIVNMADQYVLGLRLSNMWTVSALYFDGDLQSIRAGLGANFGTQNFSAASETGWPWQNTGAVKFNDYSYIKMFIHSDGLQSCQAPYRKQRLASTCF